jgi:hypothetical protein
MLLHFITLLLLHIITVCTYRLERSVRYHWKRPLITTRYYYTSTCVPIALRDR